MEEERFMVTVPENLRFFIWNLKTYEQLSNISLYTIFHSKYQSTYLHQSYAFDSGINVAQSVSCEVLAFLCSTSIIDAEQ
jgi:hypothetical protein